MVVSSVARQSPCLDAGVARLHHSDHHEAFRLEHPGTLDRPAHYSVQEGKTDGCVTTGRAANLEKEPEGGSSEDHRVRLTVVAAETVRQISSSCDR